ncbi:MAG: LysR family transcriptional regulator [Pseudomonadota bacterium]
MDAIAELTVFTEVVDAGSFVGAARRLGLTPSGVSRKISRFEGRLGVRLLNRTTRSISLTDAGQALFERCGDILSSIEAAEEIARDLSASPKGKLKIAASDALSVEVIVPFLKSFSDRYPDLSVTLIPGDGGVDLLNERVDLALLFDTPKETSFIVRKLIKDPWVVCAAPAYIKKFGKPKNPADLKQHRCLAIHARGVTTDHWAFEKGGSKEVVLIDSALSGIGLTMKDAALQGLGIARLAHFLVSKEIYDGRLTPLLTSFAPKDDRAIHAVYPNRQYLPSKVRLFVDELSAYIETKLKSP